MYACIVVRCSSSLTHSKLLSSLQMAVTSRSSVPSFTPDLRVVPAMPHCKALRSLLLSKIINAERASYHAPKFFKLTVRVSPWLDYMTVGYNRLILILHVLAPIQNRSRAQLLIELVANLTEHSMAARQGRATRKVSRRGSWLPIGASR